MIKIQEIHEKLDEYNRYYCIEIYKDDKEMYRMSGADSLSECPEDATLGRDLNFLFSIPDALKLMYEAGKNNEEIVWKEIYWNEDEEEITKDEFYE